MNAVSLEDIRKEILDGIRKDNANPVLYELGSGITPYEEFIGLDYYAEHDRVEKADLFTTPWGIADESVDYYRSSHFLEHVPDWNAHFAEVYRTLKPGGYYEIIAPYYLSRRYYQDPDHKQPILRERFAYLDQKWLKQVNIAHSPSNARVNFSVQAWFELLHDDFRLGGYSAEALEYHKLHSFNVIEDVACVLRKEPMEGA